MKTIYVADDGTQFDDEFDCIDYEWRFHHPNLNDVHIYDANSKELKDIFSDDTYNRSAKVVVTSNEAIQDLQEFVTHTGYCLYSPINQVGEWVFDEENERFNLHK